MSIRMHAMTMASFATATLLISPALGGGETEVVLSGLNNPIGVVADPDGTIWFSEMGVQGPDAPGNGKISYLGRNLEGGFDLMSFVEGIDVAFNPMGEPTGALQLTFDDNGSLLLAAGGPAIPPFPSLGSVLRYDASPAVRRGAPYPALGAAMIQQIPVFPFVVGSGYNDSNTYSIAPAGGGDLYIVDSGANILLRWDASTDALSIVTEFPGVENPEGTVPGISQSVPTRVIADGKGGAIVVQLVGFPFVAGTASIFSVDAAGTLTTMYTGFDTLVDVEMAADGSLIVSSAGAFDPKFGNFVPGTGSILRVLGDGSTETLVDDLWCPSGLAIVGDDLWYTQPFAGTLSRLVGGAPQPCPGDLNHDGVVNGADMGLLLSYWGSCF